MLRPTLPADTPALLAIATATGVFKPHEIEALEEVLDDYHDVNHTYGHQAHTWVEGDQVIGFVYFAPTAMTDRTWELWWIAVDPTRQGSGLGSRMLELVESAVLSETGRLLLIETSSTPLYEPTRRFYLRHDYVEAARIPDFYADGDGKVIFWKRLNPVVV